MKFPSAIFVSLSLLAVAGQIQGQEELSDADKALFDSLQVPEATEKSARLRIEKSRTAPPSGAALPAAAAKMLDRLAVFEGGICDVTDEAVSLSRKTLCAQLIKLSDATAEPVKTELIATAKNIEGLTPEAVLPAPATDSSFPGEWLFNAGDRRWYYRDGTIKTNAFRGTWRWLNQSNQVVVADYADSEFVDILRMVTKPGKPPMLEGFNQNANHWTLSRGESDPGKPALPAEAVRFIAVARAYESQARAASLKQAGEKRERVAAWLIDKAKTHPPASAKLLIENSTILRAGSAPSGAGDTRRNPGTFRGKIYVDNKQRPWEFLPDGTVRSKGMKWGVWEWAKSGNDVCLIICSGGPGKAEEPMLVRRSATEPGTMRFIGFKERFDAKQKP